MNDKNNPEELRSELIDALESPPQPAQLADLKRRVMAHDSALWSNFLWMQKQKEHPGGIFAQMASTHSKGPDHAAMARFLERRRAMQQSGDELERLVWSWFRRYVFAPAAALILLLGSLHLADMSAGEWNGRQELESFLGWDADILSDEQAIPELTHWLYQDFDSGH